MTKLDDRLLPRVFTMLAKYGKRSKWTLAIGTGTFNPLTRSISGATTSTISNVLISPPAPVTEKMENGESIKAGDTVVYLAALNLGFTPAIGHQVEIDTMTLVATEVNPLYSGEQIAAYEVFLRR